MMRLLGFKHRRCAEWLDVIQEEGRVLSWADRLRMGWAMIAAALALGGVSRQLWRARMRACRECPIYDRQMKRCRPQTGHLLGCGCYMPFKALSRTAECWVDEVIPDNDVGWSVRNIR